MTGDRQRRVEDVFLRCTDLPKGEQGAFLDRECARDDSLRKEVECLLQHYEDRGDFMDSPVVHDAVSSFEPSQFDDSGLPERIGRYAVTRFIGDGGMGVVYEAEQENPQRTVAIKVVRPETASATSLRRFQYEAEILGRLQHPGITHIYEAGTTELRYANGVSQKRPFIAMEYVRGLPLMDYVNGRALTVRDRLELMSRIGDAVHHAHLNGIIHRDLKPGNILVDEAGQPKIMDFGIARSTEADPQWMTMTGCGQIIGTLAYMSPEQVSGESSLLDTRTDVYSLGVILYELLASQRPLTLSGLSIPEAARRVQNDPPPLLGSLASVHADVETIVHKALEKETHRRYQTASELTADIRRYLADEPITARPTSAVYQLVKFAKRNRALVVGTGIAALALVSGTLLALWQASRAEERAEAAVSAMHDSDAATGFLETVFSLADPQEMGHEVSVKDALTLAGPKIEKELAGRPRVESRVRLTLGRACRVHGAYPLALEHLLRARDLNEEMRDSDDSLTLNTLRELGMTYDRLGRYEEAEPLYQQVFDARKRTLGDEHIDTLLSAGDLAAVLAQRGFYEDAKKRYERIVRTLERISLASPLFLLEMRGALAGVLRSLGEDAEAAAILRANLEDGGGALGGDHPANAHWSEQLASYHMDQGHFDQAERLFQQTFDSRVRLYGEDHPLTLGTLQSMAVLSVQKGESEKAEPVLLDVLERATRTLGPDHPHVLTARGTLGSLYTHQRRFPEAKVMLKAALEDTIRVLGDSSERVATLLNQIGNVHVLVGEFEEGELALGEALEICEEIFPEDHGFTAMVRSNHALCLVRLDQPFEAYEELLAAHAVFEERGEDYRLMMVLRSLIDCAELCERFDELDDWREQLSLVEARVRENAARAAD